MKILRSTGVVPFLEHLGCQNKSDRILLNQPSKAMWVGQAVPDTSSFTEFADAELRNQASNAWRRAQLVFLAPAWDGRPEAFALAEAIASDPSHEPRATSHEPWVWAQLADAHPLVVAHAPVMLQPMKSRRLREIPESVLARPFRITIQTGSFRNSMRLGAFARQMLARA